MSRGPDDGAPGPREPAPAAVPNRPRGHPRLDRSARRHLGEAFHRSGADYDAIRPSYPDGVVDFLVPAGARTAVDLGAGTGLFTAMLAGRGLAVTAVEPSAAMLEVLHAALPEVRTVQATGEHTGLPDGCADLVTAAQSWHWIDPPAGTAEAARLLGGARGAGPGAVGEAVLGIVSNQLDTAVPWVHRLSRIMHAGDVHPPRRPPSVAGPFGAPEGRWWHWTQPITPEGLHELMATRSYHLRATGAVRERMRANLDWYLLEHLGHAPGQVLELPYVTSAWRCVLRRPGDPGGSGPLC